jgi:hypothetical protein
MGIGREGREYVAAGLASEDVDIQLGYDNAVLHTSAQEALYGSHLLLGSTDGFLAVYGRPRVIDVADATAHDLQFSIGVSWRRNWS